MSGSSVTDIPHSMSETSAADAASTTTHSSSGSVTEPANIAAVSTPNSHSASVAPQNPFEQVTTPGPASGQTPDSTTSTSSKLNDASTSSLDRGNTVSANTSLIPPISPARSEGATSVVSSSSASSPIQAPRMPVHPSTPVQPEAPSPRQPQSAPLPSTSNTFPPTTLQHAVSERRPRGGAVDLSYRPQQPVFDDDETTQPSSSGNTTDQQQHQQPEKAQNMAESIARFMQNTRRRLSSAKDSEDDDFVEGAIIAGYLQKLGRNGKWQTRWFETDGECLSYYKSSKRTKLLATLDLEKVGAIGIDESDLRGCSFGIEVLGRMYHLRADGRASCRDWVITLNRVKEARMQQGNVKLVDPAYHRPPDLLDQSADVVAPRVVVVANRQRTRAVDETQEFERIMHPESDLSMTASKVLETKRRSTIGTVVLARWSKRKSSFQRLSAKLVKWARSVKRLGCDQAESVQLDRHVHPPGHDDHRRRQGSVDAAKTPATSAEALDAWIGKEASQSAAGGQAPPLSSSKPQAMRRGMSVGSEDDARYLS